MEVKEDLSDIWQQEDPDYKFLKYPGKNGKAGRERHELALSWESHFF